MNSNEINKEISKIKELRKIILRTLWELANPVTLQELSKKIGLKVRSANMHLLLLKKAGLLTISEDGYSITEKGKETIGFPKIYKETAEKILSERSPEGAFYFHTEIDYFLEVSSDSLTDFCEKISSIDIKSIEFHVDRGDFESWIHFIGDIELEERLRMIRASNLKGDKLRDSLYKILVSRCDELIGRKKLS